MLHGGGSSRTLYFSYGRTVLWNPILWGKSHARCCADCKISVYSNRSSFYAHEYNRRDVSMRASTSTDMSKNACTLTTKYIGTSAPFSESSLPGDMLESASSGENQTILATAVASKACVSISICFLSVSICKCQTHLSNATQNRRLKMALARVSGPASSSSAYRSSSSSLGQPGLWKPGIWQPAICRFAPAALLFLSTMTADCPTRGIHGTTTSLHVVGSLSETSSFLQSGTRPMLTARDDEWPLEILERGNRGESETTAGLH